MLKTTEQQHMAPDEFRKERLMSVEGTQTAQITAVELVLERESLESIQALVDEIIVEAKRRKRKLRTVLGALLGSSVPLVGLGAYLISKHYVAHLLIRSFSAIMVLGSLCITVTSAIMDATSARQKNIVDHLAASKDVRAISPLLSLSTTMNKAVRRHINGALTSLLPLLQERDAIWLTDHDIKHLVMLVNITNTTFMRKYYPDGWTRLVVATLQALGEVGDSRALGPVTALAAGDATAGDMQRIQQAAIACLIPLRKRVERDRAGQHLLRSSDAPESGSDMLLIPAVENVAADVRELPRASGAD